MMKNKATFLNGPFLYVPVWLNTNGLDYQITVFIQSYTILSIQKLTIVIPYGPGFLKMREHILKLVKEDTFMYLQKRKE